MKKLSVAFAVSALALITFPASSASASKSDATTSTSIARTTTTGGAAAARLTTIKTKSDTAVKDRITHLEDAKAELNASKYITSEHKSGLLAEIAAQESGLNALDSKIQADTTTADATTDAKKIVTDYRVYLVELPKIHEVIAIDTVTSVNAKFQAASPKLADELTAKGKTGTDVTAAQTALTDLNTKSASVASKNNGLVGPVLSLQPSGYPSNKSTLTTTRTALGSELTTLKGSRADIQTIATALGVSK